MVIIDAKPEMQLMFKLDTPEPGLAENEKV